MLRSALNVASSRSASSIAARIASLCAGASAGPSNASSSRARSRDSGVRRSCATLSVTSRIPAISRSIWSSMRLRLAASWSNSSPVPRERHAVGEVAGHDPLGGAVYLLDPAQQVAAHHRAAEEADAERNQSGPQQGRLDPVAERAASLISRPTSRR